MPLTLGALHQMVEQNDEKHEDGHARLRADWRSLELRVSGLERKQVDNENHLREIDNRKTDVTNLQFTTRTVIAIVVACGSLAAGQLALNASLEAKLIKAITDYAKIQDERSSSLKAAMESMQRRQELQQYEISSLKEAILKQGRSR